MPRSSWSDFIWKGFLIVLGSAMLALHIYGTTTWRRTIEPGTAGTMALQLGLHDRLYRSPVMELQPESPLHVLGVKVGDQIKFDHLSDAYRRVGTDESIGLTVYSGTGTTHLLVTPAPNRDIYDSPWETRTLYLAVRFSIVLTLSIALLVAWRRAEWMPVRVLMTVFLLVSVDYNYTRIPQGALSNFLYVLAPFVFAFTYCGFLYFAIAFPVERAWIRHKAIRRAFIAFVCFCAAMAGIRCADRSGFLALDTWQVSSIAVMARLIAVSSVIAGVTALWWSWTQSKGIIRQRIGWLACCTGGIYIAYFITNVNDLLGEPISPTSMAIIQTPIIVLAYFGMAYALIRHRLFDISFAVNRALVFTIISTILLVIFGVTEYAVDKLLHFEGREKNVIFDAAVALGIILSFHRIQHWVSHRIDHTFFHHWYAAASTLRSFVESAPHVTDASVLQTKYLAAMQCFCGARDIAQYLRDSDNAYRRTHGSSTMPAVIDVDHDLAIALRHKRAPIDLHHEPFGIAADQAFPMTLRGEVNGIILLLARADGGGYRPDEIKLLAECVRNYAADLESLRVEELDRKNAQLAQLSAELQRQVELLTRRQTIPAVPEILN